MGKSMAHGYPVQSTIRPLPIRVWRSGPELLKTCHHLTLLRFWFFPSRHDEDHNARPLLRRLLTQPSICGTTSPTSRSFWRTPLTRSPCTGLCPRPSRLPTRTVTGTCPMLTQRGPGSRGGTTMAPGFRMSSGPRCRCPLGNDRQMWIICRVTIPGAHIIGRILLAILRLLTLRVHTWYHCRTNLRDHLPACVVAIVQAPQPHQVQLFKLGQYLSC